MTDRATPDERPQDREISTRLAPNGRRYAAALGPFGELILSCTMPSGPTYRLRLHRADLLWLVRVAVGAIDESAELRIPMAPHAPADDAGRAQP